MLLCPKCTDSLHITDRQGIEIDFCPICRGVWLDAGELDKIIERAIQTEMQYGERPRSDFDDDYDRMPRRKKSGKYSKMYHKKHKKKHILEEIFDFFD